MKDKTLKKAAKLLRTLASATESLGKNQIALRDVEKEAREIAEDIERELAKKSGE